MRIAIIVPFSYPSICGVWNRAYNISRELVKKGNEVHVFSSNIIKGKNKISNNYEVYNGICIHRYKVKFKLGENAMFFNFKRDLLKLKPDVIEAHVYRHPHSTKVIKISKKLNIPVVLVTHAPFVEKELRGFMLNLFVSFYDIFLGKKVLNSYNKVISISRWEEPYLLKLGLNKNKIVHICNGIDKEFLKIKLNKKNNLVVYLGRIAKIKNLELLKEASKELRNVNFEVIGPIEKNYNLKSEDNFKIINKIFDKKEEIEILKRADIYVLPSKREAIPQTLLEAMGAGKIVISSDTKGGRELITSERGFIFKNKEDLVRLIKYSLDNYNKLLKVRKQAREFARELTWDKITNKSLGVYNEVINNYNRL